MKIQYIAGLIIFLCVWAILPSDKTEVIAAKRHEEYTDDQIYETIDQILQWKKKDLKIGEEDFILSGSFLEEAGTEAVDGYAFCFGRLGIDEDYIAYQAAVTRMIGEKYNTVHKLSKTNASEWHRTALSLLACGKDATSVGKEEINLIRDGVYDRGKTMELDAEGVEGAAWGLLTLDSMRYQVPEEAGDTREDIIVMILEHQMADGGFSSDGMTSDAYATSLVLTALAPYYNSGQSYHYTIGATGAMGVKSVRDVMDESLDALTKLPMQDMKSVSGAVIALSALGRDVEQEESFIEKRHTLLDELMSYQREDGGFAEQKDELQSSDNGATQEALRALTAYIRYRKGMRSLYDFREATSDRLQRNLFILNRKIARLQKTEATQEWAEEIADLYQEYLEIPQEERSYVYGFPKLQKYLQDFGVNHEEDVTSCMSIYASGTPKVEDIRSPGKMRDTKARFTKKREREAEYILDHLSVEYKYTIPIKLYEIENAKKDYSDLYERLLNAQKEIAQRELEIQTLNDTIEKELYPFDQIQMGDKDFIDDLLERCRALSEYERGLVQYYPDVEQAGTKLHDKFQRMTMYGTLSVIALFLAVIMWILGKI